MFQHAFNWLVTGLGIQELQQAVRIQPSRLPFDLVNNTCTENHALLSAHEQQICANIRTDKPIILDFVAPICGYKMDCTQDIHWRDCPVVLGEGVLSKLLMPKALESVVVEGEWMPMNVTLTCLRKTPALLAHIQSIDIQFQRSWSEWNWEYWEWPIARHVPASAKLITHTSKLLLETVHSMPNLTSFTVQFPNFYPHNVSFNLGIGNTVDPTNYNPKFKTLSLGPGTDLLLSHFSHVRNVRMHQDYMYEGSWRDRRNRESFQRLFEALSRHSKLESVHLLLYYDEVSQLGDVIRYIPHIGNLTLTSEMSLRRAMPYLRNLTSLQHLGLPHVSDLNIGFRLPFCGNSYINDPTLEDRLKKEGTWYTAQAGRLICRGLWNLDLKTLTLGGVPMNITTPECLEWKEVCQKNATLCMESKRRSWDWDWEWDFYRLPPIAANATFGM